MVSSPFFLASGWRAVLAAPGIAVIRQVDVRPPAYTPDSSTATESTAAAECHGWRRKGNCRSKHGRGEAAEKFAFHDSDAK
jgi:hypothetical protein